MEDNMVKKISFVGAVGVSLLLSVLTPAQKEAPAQKKASAPENAAAVLAIVEGTVDFCSKVAPESAEKYKDLGRLFTNGQTDEAVAQIRKSKEYKDALDKTSKRLEALSNKEALEACKAGTPAK